MRSVVIFLLMLFFGSTFLLAQPTYNDCVQALEICPDSVYSVNNIGANVTFCPGCEDDFNFCFATDNTIWFTFTTNATGGDILVNFNNLTFQGAPGQDAELQATIIQAITPCNSGSYTQIGNCVANTAGNFTLNAMGLPANTTYYIVVDGDNNGAGITDPAECSFNVSISGTGINRQASGLTLTQTETSICANDPVTFLASLQNCPDSSTYNWFINGDLVAVTVDSFYQVTTLNDGDIVSVSNTCYAQCPITVSNTATAVTVYSFPIEAGPDVTIFPEQTVNVSGSTSAPAFEWSPAYLFNDPFSLSTSAFPTETVVLTLSATENGCTLTDYLTVTVNTTLQVPNTFSPNGDNINDTWEIDGIELYPNNLMKIYDRWGQLVYQASGYSDLKSWDGTRNGKPLSESVYFYVLDLQEEGEDIIKGSVNVLR